MKGSATWASVFLWYLGWTVKGCLWYFDTRDGNTKIFCPEVGQGVIIRTNNCQSVRTDGVARPNLALPSSTVTSLSIRIISTLTSPSFLPVTLSTVRSKGGCYYKNTQGVCSVPASASQRTGISLSFILIIVSRAAEVMGQHSLKYDPLPN